MGMETKQEIRQIMFSSKRYDWRTPQDLFNELDKEFHFNLDVCADHKLKESMFYLTGENGLHTNWNGYTCWMNPPYGREITKWISKAYIQSKKHLATIVCLLPARTDTEWFWNFCIDNEIRLIKGRLKFSNHKNPAPFPSMIVVFRPDTK
jgi:phage N-6-adenine-methyltransferase